MGRIQTSIGLITGMPIDDTVNALIALAARPRDMLQDRTSVLKQEQLAVNELAAMLYAVRSMTDNLGKEDLYDRRSATSSDTSILAVTVNGSPPKGTYQFTPLRMVQSQQLLSSGFSGDTSPIGEGTFSFRFGAHVERNVGLDAFGGGQGVQRGRIRITDRSGASAEIDLTAVQTVDDVLEAINGAAAINVTAVAWGDGLRLIDHTGQTASNLRVQEVGGGTAASLGLGGIDVAADVADGQDVLRLFDGLYINELNDGNGIGTAAIDIDYELRDGTTGYILLSTDDETTLGDILEQINAAEPDKLLVEIAPDGDRLMVTDLTSGEGTFALTSSLDSKALADLGLDGPSEDGVIVGRRILGQAASALLSSLGGGNGLGTLGELVLTDRGGSSDTVDLADAETLQDVIRSINDAGVGIIAQVNGSRNGIELIDTTGATTGHLIVANGGDDTSTADKLGIAVDDNVNSVASGDMHLQVVAQNTRLDDLGGGAGVARGWFTITNSVGATATVTLDADDKTIGDVIQKINHLAVNLYATINDTGDGIVIQDLERGGGTFQINEGNKTTAKDLHLLGGAVEVEIDGQTTQVIDGSTTETIQIDEDDSLEDLITKINELAAGVTASMFNDGSARPYRLSLISDQPGKRGELLVDTSGLGFSFDETVKAQDALLVYGEVSATSTGILISSQTNTFSSALPGLTFEIKQASGDPVTVSVNRSDTDLIATVEVMVNNYTNFRKKLTELTAYNMETETAAILTGDAAALRLDTEFSYMISGRFFGAGSIQTLAEIGIELKSDGTLSFDADTLRSKFAEDPDAVMEFLATEGTGVSDKFGNLIEQTAGEDMSLLAERYNALQSTIERNEERIAALNDQLKAQRERLLLDFYRMELAIGKMQSSLSVLDALQPLTPLASTRASRS
jgi:flagellar hook-associated protein 2